MIDELTRQKARWQARWDAIQGDGCTAVPDLWLKAACTRHDRHYGTHRHRDGTPITRWEADVEMLKDARASAPNALLRNTIPFVYFIGVRLAGWTRW